MFDSSTKTLPDSEISFLHINGRSENFIVQDIVNNHLATPGKYIRPRIIQLFGTLFNLPENDQILISRAAEMIHTASLIHDDVVDEAEMRRGQQTLHHKTTNARAVLAGDFLLARVISELVTAKRYDILKTISEALEDIVEGEFMQDRLKRDGTVSKSELIEVSKKKTGALLGWCSSAVAIVTNQSKEIQDKCYSFGEKIGIGFQMIDDNLDYSTQSGKDQNKDLKDGLINFTTMNLLKSFPELYYSVHQMRGNDFLETPWTSEQVEVAKSETVQEVELILDEAKNLLIELAEFGQAPNKEMAVQEILFFIDQMKERTK
jgi:decaprenyl-diphosphate synthase subunit 1